MVIKNLDVESTDSKQMEFPFEIKGLEEDGTFEGYASTFGGDPDSYNDVVSRGAFTETITNGGRNGNGIALLWQHNAKEPIGVWKELAENSKGLKVIGKLTRGVQRADEAYLLLKDKAIKGLSIGFDTIDHEWNKDRTIRKLKKVDLWEISLVTFPANVRASITNVKSMIEEAKNERELERALRDVMSLSAAKYIVSLCKEKLFALRDSEKDVEKGIEDILNTKEGLALSNILESLQKTNECFDVKRVVPFKSWPKLPLGTSWDGPGEIRKADVKALKIMSTWYDSSKPDVKSSYKLPHHRASGYGTVWKGVAAAMAALLGARGGVAIPSSDKQGVYNHLSKHYAEFEKEPPEMRDYSMYELKQIFPEMFEI